MSTWQRVGEHRGLGKRRDQGTRVVEVVEVVVEVVEVVVEVVVSVIARKEKSQVSSR